MAVIAFARPQPEFEVPVRSLARIGDDERRLRTFGRALSVLFAAVFALQVVSLGGADLTLFFHFHHIFISGYYNGFVSFFVWSPLDYVNPDLMGNRFVPHDFPLTIAAKLAPILLAAQIPVFIFSWSLFRLFDLYAQGLVFDRRNTVVMLRLGWSMTAIGCVPLLYVPFVRLIGLCPVWFALTDGQFCALFLGLILLAIAHVIEIGRRIHQEHSEIL